MVKSHKNEMKRNFLFKGLLMLLLSCVLGMPLLADTEVVNGIEWTYTISGDTVSVGGGSSSSPAVPITTAGAIIIPSELGGKKVSGIGSCAFLKCNRLTDIDIPKGVTNIDEYAFSMCSSLTNIKIPESVISIGDNAFYDCDGLTSVEIPGSVTSVGDSMFEDCSSLTSVVMLDGVREIGFCMFKYCTKLKHVVIPEGVTEISSEAFRDCTSLMSLIIPESVTYIGRWAFSGVNVLVLRCDVPLYNSNYSAPWRIDGKVVFSMKYAMNWQKKLYAVDCKNYEEMVNYASAEVTAEMVTPKQMSVKYKVRDAKGDKVKVRAVAFLDGERSFENIVLVKTGENVPDGSEVEVNKEYSFVWNVSDDWDADLVNVKIEILVQEGGLLPQDLLTIPANGEHKEMTITRNILNETDIFNALLWCYAEGDTALTLSSGVLKTNGTTICNGMSLSSNDTLMNYLYGKMGYKVLTGDDLTYAEKMTRLDLDGYGYEQVSVKVEE